MKKNLWTVYILRNEKNALYTGITTDLQRRLHEHKTKGIRCAKFTRSSKTLALVYHCSIGDRGQAQCVEAAIKRLKKSKKETIVTTQMEQTELAAFLSLSLRNDDKQNQV